MHGADVDGRGGLFVFVICALVSQGMKKMVCCCTNHPTCPPVKQRQMKRRLRRRNEATLHLLYASQSDL